MYVAVGLCFVSADSYLPKWWGSGPNGNNTSGPAMTAVTSELMNSVLGDVLTLIQKHIGEREAPWMNRIASEFISSH